MYCHWWVLKNVFDCINLMRKNWQITEEIRESIATTNKAEESLFVKNVRDYGQSIFQDFESFFNKETSLKRGLSFILEKINFKLLIYDVPPGTYDVSYFSEFLENLRIVFVCVDKITMKPRLKKKQGFTFSWETFF